MALNAVRARGSGKTVTGNEFVMFFEEGGEFDEMQEYHCQKTCKGKVKTAPPLTTQRDSISLREDFCDVSPD